LRGFSTFVEETIGCPLPHPAIDFRTIRAHRGSQATGFEELTRQLLLAERPSRATSIEHRGPGADGGVEVLVKLSDGTSWGWQSKYWLDGFGESQVQQAKESFQSALAHYGPDAKGRLTKYVIAVPVNISGSGTAQRDDARRRWNNFVNWAAGQSQDALGRDVEIELWDETSLIQRLQRHDGLYPGIRAYWFGQLVFSAEWFRDKLQNAIAALDERYHPEDHVDVEALRVFDVLLRREQVKQDLHRDFAEARAIYPISGSPLGPEFPSVPPDQLAATNEALAKFIEFENAIDRPLPEVWPLGDWLDSWMELTSRHLGPLRYSWQDSLESRGHDRRSEPVRKIEDRLHLPSEYREGFCSPWRGRLAADTKRALLFFWCRGNRKISPFREGC
jgi:hypothetical protein